MSDRSTRRPCRFDAVHHQKQPAERAHSRVVPTDNICPRGLPRCRNGFFREASPASVRKKTFRRCAKFLVRIRICRLATRRARRHRRWLHRRSQNTPQRVRPARIAANGSVAGRCLPMHGRDSCRPDPAGRRGPVFAGRMLMGRSVTRAAVYGVAGGAEEALPACAVTGRRSRTGATGGAGRDSNRLTDESALLKCCRQCMAPR